MRCRVGQSASHKHKILGKVSQPTQGQFPLLFPRGEIMTLRTALGALLLAATLAGAGCALPQNSPLHHIAAHQPFFEPRDNVLPPAQMLMHPGPGVDGPGPGVMLTGFHRPLAGPGVGPGGAGWGGCAGGGAYGGGYGGLGYGGMPLPASQIGFISPEGMRVRWDISANGMFDSEPLIAPGKFNFPQGAIYRLKLTDIPGYPGVELYPTLEVAPTMPRTEAFIAHSFIPFQLTDEDFRQVLSGNFVTKVLYLPNAEYQELALTGVETLVSTRLDPGIDPIVEADRRGSILAIIRLGNKDLQGGGGSCRRATGVRSRAIIRANRSRPKLASQPCRRRNSLPA
jgi:hypothetical protein